MINALIALGAFASLMTLAEPAHAYLDAGTGSILLQLIIGGVTGALIVVKLYWAKVKHFLSRVISNPVNKAN